MNIKILILISFISTASFAQDVLILAGKPYKVEQTELSVCGEVGGPEHIAALFMVNSAKGIGESVADASCKAGKVEFCSEEAKTKFWVGLLFKQIRRYPSQFRSSGCLDLRKKCENLCETSKIFSKEVCQIECNQYESYNK